MQNIIEGKENLQTDTTYQAHNIQTTALIRAIKSDFVSHSMESRYFYYEANSQILQDYRSNTLIELNPFYNQDNFQNRKDSSRSKNEDIQSQERKIIRLFVINPSKQHATTAIQRITEITITHIFLTEISSFSLTTVTDGCVFTE